MTDRTKIVDIDPVTVPPLRRRATMAQVAALAGVSLKTVSRVINGEPGVTPELTTKVTAAADKLSYRHDVTASSLRRIGRNTLSIGLVLEDVANPFSSSVHRAVEDVAYSHGFLVFAGSSDEDPDRERKLVEVFSGRHVDGMIMLATGTDHSYLSGEFQKEAPIVFVDRPPKQFESDSVASDNEAGSLLGVRHLLASGHRRIGFLGDLSSLSTAESRYQGYVRALKAAKVKPDPRLVRRDLRSIENAEAAVEELLALGSPDDPTNQPLTAIFAGQNLLTIGALRVLHARGLQNRVALVGFDEVLLSDLLDPGVTVLAQDPQQIGRLAAELLFARLNGDPSPFQHIVVPTKLVQRGSGEIPAKDCVR
jgi:LacI family transcriptional regulator